MNNDKWISKKVLLEHIEKRHKFIKEMILTCSEMGNLENYKAWVNRYEELKDLRNAINKQFWIKR